METKNYTLGRGEIHFSRFKPGTEIPAGFRYIGNTPEFSLSIESEDLDHFSSDRGIREKDDSVPLEVTRTGSLTTDNMSAENIALFLYGTTTILAQAAVPAADEIFEGILTGHSYQLGISATNPIGYVGVDGATLTVTDGGATTYTVTDDYTVDEDLGTVTVVEGGAIADGDDITVNYAVKASSRNRTISGSTAIEGAMRYVAYNPKGKNQNFYLPKVKITPNGDFDLKSDEWQQLPLALEALKPTTGEAIYVDGEPAYV